MTRRIFAALTAALFAVSSANAVAFNDVLPGARAMGMGNAYGAIADDAFGVFYNPAGSANTPYVQAGGSLGRLESPVGTLTDFSAAYLRPYEPINTATIGAAYNLERQVHSGDMDTILFNYAQDIKVPNVPLSKPLQVGANFKFVNVDKGQGSGGGFGMGFDVGALARTDMGLRVGAALTDLTSYTGVPRGGVLLATAYTWDRRITFAGDFRVKGGLAEYYPGVEASFLEGLLKLRAGRGLSLDGVTTVAFGMGIDFSPVVLDVAMSLPSAGINRPGGGYEASFHYRFGAPGFAGRFVGASAAEAERLRHEIDNLEDRKKTLEQETQSAEINKNSTTGELRVLEKRATEAQDEYRSLLKKNEELDYSAADKSASLQPAPKPVALPKAPPAPKPPSWPKHHTVAAGDTLRALAAKYYGDPNLWEKIYDANPDAVDRGLPLEGAVLTIPPPLPLIMAAIGLLAAEAGDREELAALLGELGHAAEGSGRLAEALEFARERRPRAFLVVDGGGADAETLTREISRVFPLLPVVAALKTRDAARAVALMRAGAVEVVAPPWTREDLGACVSKSLRSPGTALSPVRLAPRRRSPVWYALAVGTFLAAGLGVASLKRARANALAAAARVDHWLLPVSHPSGLAFDGRDLWVIDWFSQSFYEESRVDPRVLAVRHLPAETPVAAAFAADAVWTVSADGTIVRRMRDARFTQLQRYPKAAPDCAGLAFDGLYLWTLDAHARMLSKRLLDANLTVVSRTRVPGLNPTALVWDGAALWTLDGGDRVLRRHDMADPGLVVAVLPLPEYADGAYVPKGLAWDGERFWTVGERREGKGPAQLARHRDEGAR